MLDPIDISPVAYVIDDLFSLATLLTGIAFMLVVTTLVYFVIRYRARPGRTAYYTRGDSRGAVLLSLVVAAVVFIGLDVVLAVADFRAYEKMYGERPSDDEAVVVHVFAKQFEWHFRYSGPDGTFGTKDDFTTLGELTIPTGKPILLYMRSKDVVHSFFLPNLRTKQDVLPGKIVALWFRAKMTTAEAAQKMVEQGKLAEAKKDSFQLEIACAEVCGSNHAQMRGVLTVLEPAEYADWVETASKKKVTPAKIWNLWPAGGYRIEYEKVEQEEEDEDDE